MHPALTGRRIRSALFCLLLVVAPAPLAGQDYADQVWNQLQEDYAMYVEADDFFLKNYIIGALNSGRTDSWTFTLDQGTGYAITGACDEDCTDLDIVVEDANGNVVARDEADDDRPIVEFSPNRSASYTVNVKMYSCVEEPCYFGFGIFYR
jgi:hypothetical protein